MSKLVFEALYWKEVKMQLNSKEPGYMFIWLMGFKIELSWILARHWKSGKQKGERRNLSSFKGGRKRSRLWASHIRSSNGCSTSETLEDNLFGKLDKRISSFQFFPLEGGWELKGERGPKALLVLPSAIHIQLGLSAGCVDALVISEALSLIIYYHFFTHNGAISLWWYLVVVT